MKLNNKGFAISTLMYMILTVAVILISVTLLLLSSRKYILDGIKQEALENIYGNSDKINIELHDLVPVIYNGINWQIADPNDEWYNYDNQEWANAVILKSNYRYKGIGESIDVNNEVMAMFVYIPRYEYRIEGQYGKHTNGTLGTASLPGEVKVNFISNDKTLATPGYKIHPAFTFGDVELDGIWIGKFETSHSDSSKSKTSLECVNKYCTNGDELRIIPNVVALTNNNVSNMFFASRSMSRSSNMFGLNENQIDTHMMKNSEWGAVAYLSQSKYGKYGNNDYTGSNKEVYQNKSNSLITGSSNGTPSQDTYRTTQCTYDDTTDNCGVGASTTGNITGIYDMSGGSYEYVMGVYNNDISSSGFTELPDDKYYDLYSSYDMNTACNETVCYGQALSETKGWYNDGYEKYGPIFENGRHWVQRGGVAGKSDEGVFHIIEDYGYANNVYGFRITLVKIK